MKWKCTSCQHEGEPQLPPLPTVPSTCPKCSGPITVISDTEPPPPPEGLEEHDTEPQAEAPLGRDDLPGPKGPKPKLLISTSIYALARELGAEDATKELYRQIEELSGPFHGGRHDDFLPVAFTIARARRMFDVGLFVDAGGTQIGKCRSRAFTHALEHKEFDVWLSCDDDVECTVPTLVALHEACSDGAPSVAIAPCFLRGVPLVNVAFPQVVVDRTLVGCGAKMRTALYGGFGLVAMSREAMLRIAERTPRFRDDDGKTKVGAFLDLVVPHPTDDDGPTTWLGEDLSFFARVPPSVRVEALMTGHTRHAGNTLSFEKIPDYETFKPTDEWQAGRRLVGMVAGVTERRVLEGPPSVVDGAG